MKKLLLVLLLLLGVYNVNASELYMQNNVGGYITITDTPCYNPNLAKKYPKKVYYTNSDDLYREGCYATTKVGNDVNVLLVEQINDNKFNMGVFSYKEFSSKKKHL